MEIEISLIVNMLSVTKLFVEYVANDLLDTLIKFNVIEKKLLIGFVEVTEIKLIVLT